MLRVIDVKAALESLPVAPAARGELVVEVRDEMLPQNQRAWRVQAREGRLAVRPEPSTARDPRPRLGATAEALAIIASGALSPVRAGETGLLESARGAAELVEPWFHARPVFLMPMNAF